MLDRLAAVLGLIADAWSTATRATPTARWRRGRLDTQYDHLSETLSEAGDAARISLSRRGSLTRLDRYVVRRGRGGARDREHEGAARGASRAIALDDSIPPEVPAAIHELATAARELTTLLEDGGAAPSREAALRAVRLANAVLAETSNLSAVHIVGQVRLVAVDLLRAGGVSRADAQEAVRTAPGEPLDPRRTSPRRAGSRCRR